MDKENSEEIFNEAIQRYHTDTTFHNLVNLAVDLSVPKVKDENLNTALQEAGVRGAAVVLILKEKNDFR